MTDKELENIQNSIKEKIGEDNMGLILDDLAQISIDNTNQNNLLNEKNKEITNLKEKNNTLIQANGNLFQQISFQNSNNDELEKNNEPKSEPFILKNAFNDKGEFI